MNATAVSFLQGSRLAVMRLIVGSTAFVVAAGFAQAYSPTANAPAAQVPTETVLYSFSGGADGGSPIAGLIFDTSGALYGTTAGGGGSGLGYGTVFKLTPPAKSKSGMPWTETVLYSFSGGADGRYPHAGLVFDTSGALYGTTFAGAAGTVFKLTPPAKNGMPWTETVLHSFTGQPDGNGPEFGSLIFDTSGALYGTTLAGGAWDQGMVFKLTPPAGGETPWTETVLYSFTGGADGGIPQGGLIFDTDGALYGTTGRGGGTGLGNGTVFKLTPPAGGGTPWTETVLHRFLGGSDGNNPRSGVIFDTSGALYGTTAGVGLTGVGNGTVFKLTPPAGGGTRWTETVLHNFSGPPDGSNPVAGLIFDTKGALLYGTTPNGGVAAGGGHGTVFKLTPPDKKQNLWTETVLYSFTGGGPIAGLIFDKKGALYGTTAGGGTAGSGTVFQFKGTKH